MDDVIYEVKLAIEQDWMVGDGNFTESKALFYSEANAKEMINDMYKNKLIHGYVEVTASDLVSKYTTRARKDSVMLNGTKTLFPSSLALCNLHSSEHLKILLSPDREFANVIYVEGRFVDDALDVGNASSGSDSESNLREGRLVRGGHSLQW